MTENRGRMDGLTEVVVRVAAAVGTRDSSFLDRPLDAAEALALEQGPEVIAAIDEVLLQSILFVGYPAGLDALAAWRRRVPTPAACPEEDPTSWVQRGERVCQTVYGSQYGRLRDNIRSLHPHVERWMISDGYGRVLGRSGLGLATRELCIVAQLAVLGAYRQLFSHALGALRVGASSQAVARALQIGAQWLPPEAGETVERIWTEVQEKASSPDFSIVPTES